MALTKAQKTTQLQELKAMLEKAQSTIFTQYIGLTVAEVSDLRRKLKETGAEMKVGKKTLMKIAAKELGLPEIEDSMMTGAVACVFSYSDPVGGAQAAMKYAKDHPQVSFLGGIFEGKLLTAADAKALASLPNRQVLLATFAGMLQSPLRSFASILNQPLSGFARATAELAKKGGATPQAA